MHLKDMDCAKMNYLYSINLKIMKFGMFRTSKGKSLKLKYFIFITPYMEW